MPKPVLSIIVASTRPGRAGLGIANWFHELALARGAFDVEFVDLAVLDLPLLNEPRQPVTRHYEFEHTKRWSTMVERADAFVFVMPEYNHSYNAALKNALDYLYHEWRDKPVGLVGYGGGALGARAIEAIKPVLTALGLNYAGELSISLARSPVIDDVFSNDAQLDARADSLLSELDFATAVWRDARLARDAHVN
ncbi:MAG: NAD(P)H-dependent oxidoreductase [Acidobacteria bacterium]|nr:NAD(P)H-dependent oxidoreductase [Acidobacteriota bacterium]